MGDNVQKRKDADDLGWMKNVNKHKKLKHTFFSHLGTYCYCNTL